MTHYQNTFLTSRAVLSQDIAMTLGYYKIPRCLLLSLSLWYWCIYLGSGCSYWYPLQKKDI